MSSKRNSLKRQTEIFDGNTITEVEVFDANSKEIFECITNNDESDDHINLKKATEKLRRVVEGSKVMEVPEGEPLFLFSSAVGKTRPINVFYDKGCSHVVF